MRVDEARGHHQSCYVNDAFGADIRQVADCDDDILA